MKIVRLVIFVLLLLSFWGGARAAPSATGGQVRIQAIDAWKTELVNLGDNRQRRIELLLLLAEGYQGLGFLPEAQQAYEEAAPLVRESASQEDDARLLSGWGDLLLSMGQERKAVEILSEGVALADEGKNTRMAGRLLNNMGNALLVAGEPLKAEEAYRTAEERALAEGDDLLLADIAFNRARLAFRMGENASFLEGIDRARAAFLRLEDAPHKAFGLVSLGKIALDAGRTHLQAGDGDPPGMVLRAYDLFRLGEQVAQRIDDHRSLSQSLGFQGQAYEMEGRHGEALRLTRSAYFHAQQGGSWPELLYQWQWQLGRLLAAQGKRAEALNHYRLAVETLATVRHDLLFGLRDAPFAFSELIRPVYYQMADLLLQAAGAGETDAPQLLLEARDTVELMKTAEIQNLFHDECVAALKSREASVTPSSDGTAIFYPILLGDRLELLLSLPGEMVRHRVEVGAVGVEEEANRMRAALEKGEDQSFLPHARRLHDWLIAPLLKDLRRANIHTLVVVPDGALRTIPFSALHDGNRYLVESVAIAVTPSLKLTDPRAVVWHDRRMLILALSEGVQGFPPLPNVPREVAGTREFFSARVLADGEFTTDEAISSLHAEPYSIVHIASHGQFDRDPEKTFLLTHDGRLTMDRLDDMIGFGRFRDQAVELLTLSACQTAVGDDLAALGLAGVAIKAGARSALASLWFVDDEATSQLMVEFYRRLREGGRSKAQALREAQTALLANREMTHPSRWGAFILIGNWL